MRNFLFGLSVGIAVATLATMGRKRVIAPDLAAMRALDGQTTLHVEGWQETIARMSRIF